MVEYVNKKEKIMITKDGPYIAFGSLPLDKQIIGLDEDNDSDRWIKGEIVFVGESCALCRCGKSGNKPFCDGTHGIVGFDGTETASKKLHKDQSQVMDGPALKLYDAVDFCSEARFCHRGGGTWELTHNSDDPKSKKLAIQEACNCPSGRLVLFDKKTGKFIEPKFEKSLSLVEDPQLKVSGPIWVKGGVIVESSDGTSYEVRNRQTLCRCGKSENKPFCDGTHIKAGFNDGDKSLK